jgi:hypothetical protein
MGNTNFSGATDTIGLPDFGFGGDPSFGRDPYDYAGSVASAILPFPLGPLASMGAQYVGAKKRVKGLDKILEFNNQGKLPDGSVDADFWSRNITGFFGGGTDARAAATAQAIASSPDSYAGPVDSQGGLSGDSSPLAAVFDINQQQYGNADKAGFDLDAAYGGQFSQDPNHPTGVIKEGFGTSFPNEEPPPMAPVQPGPPLNISDPGDGTGESLMPVSSEKILPLSMADISFALQQAGFAQAVGMSGLGGATPMSGSTMTPGGIMSQLVGAGYSPYVAPSTFIPPTLQTYRGGFM